MLQNQSLQTVIQQLNETVGSWQTYYYEVFNIVLSTVLIAFDEQVLSVNQLTFCHDLLCVVFYRPTVMIVDG